MMKKISILAVIVIVIFTLVGNYNLSKKSSSLHSNANLAQLFHFNKANSEATPVQCMTTYTQEWKKPEIDKGCYRKEQSGPDTFEGNTINCLPNGGFGPGCNQVTCKTEDPTKCYEGSARKP